MFTALLERVVPFRWYAIGGVALVVMGYVAMLNVDIAHLRAKLAEANATFADYRREQARAAFVASESNRKREGELRAQVETAQHAYADLQAEHARAIVAQRRLLADNGKLRNDIDAYARASGSAPGTDTVAAASERAAALGVLLAEALRADAESANAAEENADAVRTILDAWPR